MTKNEYVCLDCGVEAQTRKGGCQSCCSVRMALISWVDSVMPNWREAFEPNPDPVTPEHPEYKAAAAAGEIFTKAGESP